MSKKGYTLLEYLVTLEKQIRELQLNSGSGDSGGGDNTELINRINQVQQELNNLKTLVNNNLKVNTRTDYIYVAKDSNTYNLFADNEIKVYDDFNNFLLKENENYKRNGTTLTFNYMNPIKLRIEYYEGVE